MDKLRYDELLNDYTLLVELIIEGIAKGENIDELLEIKEQFDQLLGLPVERS